MRQERPSAGWHARCQVDQPASARARRRCHQPQIARARSRARCRWPRPAATLYPSARAAVTQRRFQTNHPIGVLAPRRPPPRRDPGSASPGADAAGVVHVVVANQADQAGATLEPSDRPAARTFGRSGPCGCADTGGVAIGGGRRVAHQPARARWAQEPARRVQPRGAACRGARGGRCARRGAGRGGVVGGARMCAAREPQRQGGHENVGQSHAPSDAQSGRRV